MYCLKTYIGQILYGGDYEHCAGFTGEGCTIECKKCSQFCSSVYQVASRKHEIFEKWGLNKSEIRIVNKEL